MNNNIKEKIFMSNNIQKYTNWKSVTESDYVTMFIKTWFAFVATLRELYPKEDLDDIIGKGDKVFLNPYLDDFSDKYFFYNKINKIKENILLVYKLGRIFTLENKKYNRFFQDFYNIKGNYHWKKQTDDYECNMKISSGYILSIHAKYLDKDFYLSNKPLIITYSIDISDLISSEYLEDFLISKFLDDETAYINFVLDSIIKRVSDKFIDEIDKHTIKLKHTKRIYNKFTSLSLLINQEFISELNLMKSIEREKDRLLIYQIPCTNFIYKIEDGADIPNIETYSWFLNFVYFMRNALFHEIIDPLDYFWQDIFKHSYIVLKEILDGNINYLLEKDQIKNPIYNNACDEISKKIDVYLPNFNENFNNGDLDIVFESYCIDEVYIKIKANISLDYWYNNFCMKRMISICKVEILHKNKTIKKFNMELKELKDI